MGRIYALELIRGLFLSDSSRDLISAVLRVDEHLSVESECSVEVSVVSVLRFDQRL